MKSFSKLTEPYSYFHLVLCFAGGKLRPAPLKANVSQNLKAVDAAQLVKWLLPTQEIHGLNPDTGKILSTNCAFKYKKENETRKGRFLVCLLMDIEDLC